MPSSLFRKSSVIGSVTDPNAMFSNMMNTNPQFSKFVRENANLSMEQIAGKYGIDPDLVRRIANERRS